ncbi:MAG: HAMP domain-containing histidine kinase [Candidatus Aminicenantes bacterium]|nr:HAMP domain-containing histidine kinase [Candidatus Aminicenantes bacterium]
MAESGIIKNIISLFDSDVDYEESATFRDELNRQCNLIVVPSAIVALVSWLPYIPLDIGLYGKFAFIPYLRVGFSLVGLTLLILHLSAPLKKRSYWLLFALMCYLELTTAAIVGLVNADPIYMGGYGMLILVLPLVPFEKMHALFILLFSLVEFFLIVLVFGMKSTPLDKYGLYNIIAAAVISAIAILILDNIRKISFEKSKLDYLNNMQLKVISLEIVQANEELKKANDLQSSLIEITAHDLRNPLQTIIGCTELLQGELHGDPQSAENLESIYRSTDNMINLSNRLLSALSIESGKLELNKSNVDIGGLANSVVQNSQPNAEKKKQSIFFSTEKECFVYGDEMLLREIFENLLGNAIKFSQPGKSIWVTVGRQNSLVTYNVRDEGPGLNQSDKEKIFTRYQKLSAKPTGGESSTGLGLSIVKDLVELHKGNLRVESEAGKGSAFIVELPQGAQEGSGGAPPGSIVLLTPPSV